MSRSTTAEEDIGRSHSLRGDSGWKTMTRCRIYLMYALSIAVPLLPGCGGDGSGPCTEDCIAPCTEAGIRAAIGKGGGPFTFDCDGPTSVTTTAEIVIDRDVVLNGEGLLTVDAQWRHRVVSVREGVSAELHRLDLIRGVARYGGGIANEGSLTLRSGAVEDCITDLFWDDSNGPVGGSGVYNAGEMLIVDTTVSDNNGNHTRGGGILNASTATLTLESSTVSGNLVGVDNGDGGGAGIKNDGEMRIVNSTISNNEASGLFSSSGGGIANSGRVALIYSTVAANEAQSADAIGNYQDAYLEVSASIVDGECGEFASQGSEATWVSNGYNVESPGHSCKFEDPTDQTRVIAEDLDLGPLERNGGSTQTHALGAASVAIDVISESQCHVDADQRGQPRPSGVACDVGAFEAQP